MRIGSAFRWSGAAALLATSAPALAQERAVPYWASIAAGQAMMRAGPDRSYPATWLYKRRDLPVRVLQVHGPWRRVQERDGTQGWMLAILLAARRTAIVARAEYQPIRDAPADGGRLLWQAQAGVIGRIAKCDGRWCRIEVGDHRGFIAEDALWGVDAGERVD